MKESRQYRLTVKLITLKNDAKHEGMTISDYVRVKLFYEKD